MRFQNLIIFLAAAGVAPLVGGVPTNPSLITRDAIFDDNKPYHQRDDTLHTRKDGGGNGTHDAVDVDKRAPLALPKGGSDDNGTHDAVDLDKRAPLALPKGGSDDNENHGGNSTHDAVDLDKRVALPKDGSDDGGDATEPEHHHHRGNGTHSDDKEGHTKRVFADLARDLEGRFVGKHFRRVAKAEDGKDHKNTNGTDDS